MGTVACCSPTSAESSNGPNVGVPTDDDDFEERCEAIIVNNKATLVALGLDESPAVAEKSSKTNGVKKPKSRGRRKPWPRCEVAGAADGDTGGNEGASDAGAMADARTSSKVSRSLCNSENNTDLSVLDPPSTPLTSANAPSSLPPTEPTPPRASRSPAPPTTVPKPEANTTTAAATTDQPQLDSMGPSLLSTPLTLTDADQTQASSVPTGLAPGDAAPTLVQNADCPEWISAALEHLHAILSQAQWKELIDH